MLRAEMSAPDKEVEELEYDASGVVKFWERWFSIGVSLSSSSNRGNALDVAYVEVRVISMTGTSEGILQVLSRAYQ